ncbi:hypothetical protein [Flavivirga jejuensis]|uniref:Uncharacterized protein n=1 Tax=Flavivirga jejuensis TaxID=870487 RepID=A0ABT8WS93_9FLAO|nr:hypothetical protein [Flavivirga jejuensis]MDO5976057.1 hypothetical protein [Flavivirga jejuensis]
MKNKLTLTFCTFLFTCFISLFFSNKAIAQENGIYELSNNNFSKSAINKKTDEGRTQFNKLAYNLHPTVYIENGLEKQTYGEGLPIKLTFEDTKSLNLLNSENVKYNQVQLITIKINSTNDLNNTLDLSNVPGLNKLIYIYLKCNFKCTAELIKGFIKVNPQIRVFYTSKKPS